MQIPLHSICTGYLQRYTTGVDMKIEVATAILILLIVGSAFANPVILSSDDINDNYYAETKAPGNLTALTDWLGLYVNAASSRVEAARANLVPRRENSQTIYRIVTNPQNAAILFSGVPLVSSGAAITVAQNIDLGSENREADIKLGLQVYKIRLQSSKADLCDAVITVSGLNRTQKLFQPNVGSSLACDDPHFRIHWAGDIDRDGRLDLLVTFSQKYSFFSRRLLLSSAARKDELVSEVAIYTRTAQ
jgi:hypothetical protein